MKTTKPSTLIKIAPTAQEKVAEKEFKAYRDDLLYDKDRVERNYDQFEDGPMHGYICKHQPNGPRPKHDPKGYWAGYFFKDIVTDGKSGMKTTKYQVYSTVRGFLNGSIDYPEHNFSGFHAGVRGAYHRKMYYYCGAFTELELQEEGIVPENFIGILQIA